MYTSIWKDELFFLSYLEKRKMIAAFQKEALSLEEYIGQELKNIATVFCSFCERKLTWLKIGIGNLQEELQSIISELASISSVFRDRPNPLFFLVYDSCYKFCSEYLAERLQDRSIILSDFAQESEGLSMLCIHNQKNTDHFELSPVLTPQSSQV